MALDVVTLRDDHTGSQAKILPDIGFNCFSFQAVADSEPIELLWSDPQFTTGTQKPARSGIPILFPFAGRIRGTAFTFQGREYALEPGDDFGNAIHGFVLKRPWRMVEQGPTRAAGEFQASIDAPDLLARWPADFQIRAEYGLNRNALDLRLVVTNPSENVLPFWLGTHGYFRVPLGAAGTADACLVQVPAKSHWELEQLMPTGRKQPLALADKLQRGLRFAESRLDDVLADFTQTGRIEATVNDPASGRTVHVSFAGSFAACVVFNPPHREAICIEPYTAVPNAFELDARGIDAGLRVLPPGEQFETWIKIELV